MAPGSRPRSADRLPARRGQSQVHHDAWFVGYTPELAAAVWVGFPEGQVTMEPPTTPYTITGGIVASADLVPLRLRSSVGHSLWVIRRGRHVRPGGC